MLFIGDQAETKRTKHNWKKGVITVCLTDNLVI